MDKEVRAILDAIYKRDGVLEASKVVEASRDVASPLHKYFKWDDEAGAAHQWRLAQARGIIQTFEITYVVRKPRPKQEIELVHREWSPSPSGPGYKRTSDLLAGAEKQDWLAQEYNRVMGHVNAFVGHLRAAGMDERAADVLAAMERVKQQLEGRKAKTG